MLTVWGPQAYIYLKHLFHIQWTSEEDSIVWLRLENTRLRRIKQVSPKMCGANDTVHFVSPREGPSI